MKDKLITAIKIYTEIAFPQRDMPEKIKNVVERLEQSKESELFNYDFFERVDENVFALRLGNIFYPHMKLVVKIEENDLLFNVDTHDSPERIPPNIPGYDKFKKVIEFNRRIKSDIMEKLYPATRSRIRKENDNGVIVFLDDEDYILNIFKNLSQCLGLKVKTYKSGKKLLNDIEKEELSPSVCFVDIMMPEISGYDFVSKLRKKRLKRFPVIFTTGVNPAKLKKDLCDDYLLKPVSLKEIEGKLKKFKLL